MPVTVVDAAQCSLAELKELGDQVMARLREALRTHKALARQTTELRDEIDRLHHRATVARS